jgi:hypothetical protein
MRLWIRALDRVLKGEATRPDALAAGTLDLPAGGLSVLLVLLGAFYGACMGAFALVTRWGGPAAWGGARQIVYSAAKVPMLFTLTMLITLPSLYVFNALVGGRLSFGTVLRMLIASLGVMLAVLASVGTIVIFFSLCTTSYPFMVLLNVVVFTVAGALGMHFLVKTLHRLAIVRSNMEMDSGVGVVPAPIPFNVSATSPPALPPISFPSPAPGRQVRTLFAIWVIVFGLVGAQMGWVLRPFIGAPSAPVTFFRPREGNFFQAVADKLTDLATESGPRQPWTPTTRDSEGDSRRSP